MDTLIVGGTGMIGSHIAGHLRERGHAVTLASRSGKGGATGDLPVLQLDYTDVEHDEAELARFDSIVFAAGNDIRHIPRDADRDRFWDDTQIVGVPRFAEAARRAGVRRFVQLGSYYHQVLPDLIETNDYVRARALADDRTRALADETFAPITLNPPSIVGVVPGPPMQRIARFLAWADGELADVPDFMPSGGTNFMSVRSLAQAVEGALANGESGKAYLVGDANLTFREYMQTIFDAAGSDIVLEERDEEHPLWPDAFIVQGRGNTISYETDPLDLDVLGFDREDIQRAIAAVVDQTRRRSR